MIWLGLTFLFKLTIQKIQFLILLYGTYVWLLVDGYLIFLKRLDLRGHRIRSLTSGGLHLSPNLEVNLIFHSVLVQRFGTEMFVWICQCWI